MLSPLYYVPNHTVYGWGQALDPSNPRGLAHLKRIVQHLSKRGGSDIDHNSSFDRYMENRQLPTERNGIPTTILDWEEEFNLWVLVREGDIHCKNASGHCIVRCLEKVREGRVYDVCSAC